jgi:hypothetical protein
MSARKTRANQKQYQQTRKEANKICKEKKKQWLNDNKTNRRCT